MEQKNVFPAGENIEGMVLVDPNFFGDDENMFVLRADGNGMRGAGINHGDLLVFSPDKRPQDGDIVILASNGQQICRRIFFEGQKLRIRREDAKTPDILTDSYSITAVLVGSMRSYRT